MFLTKSQVEQFDRDGFLILPNVFSTEELQPLIDEHLAVIDSLARDLKSRGLINDLYENEPFERRFVHLNQADSSVHKRIDIMHTLGRETFKFFTNKNLLDVVEGLVGPEITLSPVQHVRAKLPTELRRGGSHSHEVPWHQDSAVVWPEADPFLCLTAWVALSDSTIQNGCVKVIPGLHKDGLLEHIQTKAGTTIKPELVVGKEAVAAELTRGGLLLMHNFAPHCSVQNLTDSIRWSLDLRFLKTGMPTGRPFHPEFVVRSSSNPTAVLSDYNLWRSSWKRALSSSDGIKYHRFHAQHDQQREEFYQKRSLASTVRVSHAPVNAPNSGILGSICRLFGKSRASASSDT